MSYLIGRKKCAILGCSAVYCIVDFYYYLCPTTTVDISADPTDISQPKIDIQTTQQVLNVQFGKLAAYRLNTLPDSVAAGARLAISAILAVAEQTAKN